MHRDEALVLMKELEELEVNSSVDDDVVQWWSERYPSVPNQGPPSSTFILQWLIITMRRCFDWMDRYIDGLIDRVQYAYTINIGNT